MPSNVKKLKGTYRPDRAASNEPQPQVKAPSCPAWLHAEAKREWKRIIKILLANGLVTELDRAALAAYCQAYAEWWEMERVIKENGRWGMSETGYFYQMPWVNIRNAALDRMDKFGKQFGYSPSARTRVSAEPEKEERPSNPYANLASG